jgi:hypothetical protein
MVHATGCSVIGFAAGYATDRRNAAEARKRPIEFGTIPFGTNVSLRTTVGEELSGIYTGTAPLEVDEFNHSQYDLAEIENTRLLLPHKGESVTVTLASGAAQECTFEGITTVNVLLRPHGQKRTWPIPFGHISEVQGPSGQTLSSASLAALSQRGFAPSERALVLERNGQATLVPLEDVSTVAVPSSSHEALKGLLIGAIGDAIIYGVYHYITNWEWSMR